MIMEKKPVLMKVAIVVVLIAAIGFVISQKEDRVPVESGDAGDEEVFLPSLVDIGSDVCVPCKMMAPILEELDQEYQGIFDVQFINTRDDESATRYYEVRMIPTQIFYDAEGNELFRHEGFFSKEDILNKWKELGIDIQKQ
jgi:thioredoxin 1